MFNVALQNIKKQITFNKFFLLLIKCTKLHGVKANEVKIMVIEHTVRPASNQGAPDDAPEFALAPTTYNRKGT